MRRIFEWYRSRGIFLKILLPIAIVVIGIPLLYAGIRSVSYLLFSASTIDDLATGEYDCVIHVNDVGDAVEAVKQNKVLSDYLKSGGMDVGQLEMAASMIKGSANIFLTTDIVRSEVKTKDFLIVSRVGFKEYLGLPFLGMVKGAAGIQQNGDLYLKDKIYFTFSDDIVIASSNQKWITKTIAAPKPVKLPGTDQIYGKLRNAKVLTANANKAKLFGVDVGQARSLEFQASISPGDVVLTLKVEGAAQLSSSALKLEPTMLDDGSYGAGFSNAQPYNLWEYVKASAYDEKPGEQTSPAKKDMRALIARMEEENVPTTVLQLLSDSYEVVCGNSLREGRNFLNLTINLPVRNPADAPTIAKKIEDFCSHYFQDTRAAKYIEHRMYRIIYFEAKMHKTLLMDTPCITTTQDGLVLSTDMDFMKLCLDSRDLRKGSQGPNLKRLTAGLSKSTNSFGEGDIFWGMVNMPDAHTGIRGYIPIIAQILVEQGNYDMKFRGEVEREYRAQGKFPVEEEIQSEIRRRMNEVKMRNEKELADDSDFMRKLGKVALRIYPSRDGISAAMYIQTPERK